MNRSWFSLFDICSKQNIVVCEIKKRASRKSVFLDGIVNNAFSGTKQNIG